jgi:hypothetical protein
VSQTSLAQTPSEVDLETFEERAAIINFDGGAPLEWAEGLARLHGSKAPDGMTQRRWQQVLDEWCMGSCSEVAVASSRSIEGDAVPQCRVQFIKLLLNRCKRYLENVADVARAQETDRLKWLERLAAETERMGDITGAGLLARWGDCFDSRCRRDCGTTVSAAPLRRQSRTPE